MDDARGLVARAQHFEDGQERGSLREGRHAGYQRLEILASIF
jgi:hypothetical protein